MPIEFRCPQCSRLLRTPDDAAGKQAQCPECGTLSTIPVPAAAPATPPQEAGTPFGLGGPTPVAAGETMNPYQSPAQSGTATVLAPPDPMAASRVSGPATALIVTGALGLALQLLGLVANLAQLGMGAGGRHHDALPMMFSGGIGAVTGVIGIVVSVVIIMGALRMKNLESYGFAMTSAIIAMIPCISPCCLLGLPFGIWALVVLSDASVKAAFRG